MTNDSRDDRLLDLARRLLAGEAIDWDKEGIAEAEVREGMKRLQLLIGRRDDRTETEEAPPPEPPKPPPPRPSPKLREDRFIGDFRLVRKLGEGGMGVVYEAEQQHPRRPVALKVIRGGAHVSPETLKLFQREAQTLARLRHPGIAALYETGATEDGLHYFAMELVRGSTLSSWLGKRPAGPVTPEELKLRLSVFKRVCDAVAYAHQKGVIHRDLKPGNVLIPKSSEGSSMPGAVPDVKVLDFGLARMTDSDVQATTYMTEVGQVRGTLPYMSPEQVQGNPDEIDLRTDVYSLGVMLYEMLTGKLPYDLSRAQIPEAVRIICDEAPRSISTSFAGTRHLDADVITIVGKCLEKEATRRYQSAAQLAEDVQRYLSDQPILARPPSAGYQLRKLAARHKGAFAFAGTVFVLVTALAITSTVQAVRISRERDRANQEAETAKQVSEFLEGLFKVSDPSESRGNTITARELLDEGAVKIERELHGQPAIQAHLMRTMAGVYGNLALYSRAYPLAQRSLALVETAYGKDSLETADVLNVLGALDTLRGLPERALEHQGRALAIRERLAPDDAARLARGIYYVGTAQSQLGKQGDALRSYQRGLGILESSGGPPTETRIWLLNDMAIIHDQRGEFDRGAELFRKAQELRDQIYPPDHPDRILGYNNIASALIGAGRLDEARPWIERCVPATERVLGADHPGTAFAIHTLGELERRAGNLAVARALLERAMRILEKTVDPNAPQLADVLLSLGQVDRAEGRNADAEAVFRRLLEVQMRAYGPEHPALAPTLDELAATLRAQARDAEARPLERRAAAIRTRGGDVSPGTAGSASLLPATVPHGPSRESN